MSDNKSAIEKLKEIKSLTMLNFIGGLGVFWLMKKIIIEQDQRINDLELAVAKLTGAVESDEESVAIKEPKSTCGGCKHVKVINGEPCDSCDDNYCNYEKNVPLTQRGSSCFTCKHQRDTAEHEPCLTCKKGHTNHEYKDEESTTKPKYLVRPDDYSIFDLDESNGCYRLWSRKPTTYMDGTRPNAMKHFTYENLTRNYGFFPINENEIEMFELKCNEHYKFITWQNRPDGHGGVKGGTYVEYLKTLKNSMGND